jgi:GNAT superfamily N-acetyltransferase
MAGADDLDAIVDIASIVDPPADGADLDVGYYEHLLRHGHVAVAEASDIVVGYAATVEVDGTRHLSDLFLHVDARGGGIGRALLDEVWDADAEDVPRQTFASLHPAALPLYTRAGMVPRWPLLYLHGSPATLPAAPLTVRLVGEALAAGHELEWLGWDRQVEYGYWAHRAGARTFAVLDGDAPIAVGCTVRHRSVHTLGRLVAVDSSVMREALAAASRWCGGDLLLSAPGTSPVVPMLVDAGWRVVEHDLYCASAPGLVDTERLLPHPGLL